MKNPNQKTETMVRTALMTALCCVATMAITVPSPMGGYVNMGDCIVLLSAWMLGPLYGAVAAGAGSALADLLSGYAHYALATLLIKGCMAIVAAMLWKVLKNRKKIPTLMAQAISVFPAQAIMVLGYLTFDGLILGYGTGALANIPGNLVQSSFALVASLGLAHLLVKIRVMKS